ncbi:MAG: tRNA pseudouridine(55) synthase TruB [Saprospiraceae bacterium]|nr:tRNA pseudouridine(55) synthase TruB [Saprospiraceae bacterium]
MVPDHIFCRTNPVPQQPLPSGCLVLVDKPLTWTSFDVVNKIRFAVRHTYKVKKVKVGHAGTLDPLASGLLLVCIGPYTKTIDTLQSQSKVYTGTIQLGATTPTYDGESTPENFKQVPEIDRQKLEDIISSFTGDLMQTPPIYSAIKMDGAKAYQLARRGEEVDMKKRPVSIFDLKLELQENNILTFEAHCSKGTYIRSLAHDIGQFVGCGAYLSSLRRESIGSYSVGDALSLDHIISTIQSTAT